jgi:ribosomal protein L24
MSVGKVMVVCNHCGKPTRIGLRREEDNRERVCKRCGEAIVVEEKA